MEEQQEQPNKVKKFLKETLRVIRITKKPNREEYITLTKVTGLGIAILGLLGFVIFIIKQLLL